MAKRLRLETFVPLAQQELRAGEETEVLFFALGPSTDIGGAFGWAGAFPLLWLSRHVARKRLHRSVTRRSDFPVARRMVITLTNERLLVWSASRGWRPGALIGDVTRDRIIGATSPTVGQGWRTLRIAMATGEPVAIKVMADAVDGLIADLSGQS